MFDFKNLESAEQLSKEGYCSWNNILYKQCTHLITKNDKASKGQAVNLLERLKNSTKNFMSILIKLKKENSDMNVLVMCTY